MIKACIFDLDGVIVDSAKYHYQAWKRLAKEFDYDLTEQENEKLKGVSRMASLEYILDAAGIQKSEPEQQALASKKNDWYRTLIQQMDASEILPNVTSFLDELKANNIKIAIGSASKNARYILEKIGLIQIFDSIVDGTNIIRSKPDPQTFLLGAAALDVKPYEAVVFEDAFKGIEAANNGGFISIGVGNKEVLHNADHVISSIEEIDFESLKRITDKQLQLHS